MQTWQYLAFLDAEQLPMKTIETKAEDDQKATTTRNPRRHIIDGVELRQMIEAALRSRAHLGAVYLNRGLTSQFAVPLALRSSSPGMRSGLLDC